MSEKTNNKIRTIARIGSGDGNKITRRRGTNDKYVRTPATKVEGEEE